MKNSGLYLFVFIISIIAVGNLFAQSDPFADKAPQKISNTEVMDKGPNSKPVPIPSDAQFDLIFEYPCAVGGGEAGIETDGIYIYTTKWNGDRFYKYSNDGTFVDSLIIPGVSNIRDLAWDGNYFYGGAASPTLYEIDLENATLIGSFSVPTDVRAIAYDEDEDAFYANNWSSEITKFNKAGYNLGSFAVGPVGDSYYGFAYENPNLTGAGPFLWGYAQVGATQNELIQIELPSGSETGVYFDVGAVVPVIDGFAGGLSIHQAGNVIALIGLAQNEYVWGLELAFGWLLNNDIGIISILEPASSVGGYTTTEPVTVRIENFGWNPQSNMVVSFSHNGSPLYFDTVFTIISLDETYDHTFDTTIDMSMGGDHLIEACTHLIGDENVYNDCKTKMLTSFPQSLCLPEYSNGCTVGDGFTDFALEEIENYDNGCEDNTGYPGWSEYYELGPATLFSENTHTFTMATGYSNQHVNIWIDSNDDLLLTTDEMILFDYLMTTAGILHNVDITIPADAAPGLHKMRIMAVWPNSFTDPCGSYSYGEAEDYNVFIAVPDYGNLEGSVIENTGGAPVEGALISVNNGGWTTISLLDGTYSLSNILTGDWQVVCSKEGYNIDTASVTITIGDTTIKDFALTSPTMNIVPLSVNVVLDPNTQATEIINISNTGDGPLDWASQIEFINEDSKDFFDLIWAKPVGVGGGEAGIETNGNYIYTTKWNGTGQYYRYSMTGEYLEDIMVEGATATRDMAFDGNYFYGGAANPTVFELELDNATLVSSFSAPTDCRAIAYNENEDVFYANNWGSDIVKFNKSGALLGSFPVGPVGDSYYGFAYDNYMSGIQCLWGYAQVGTSQNELIQIELPSGWETGTNFDVGSIVSISPGGLAGGLAIDNHISGLFCFLGMVQNEYLWAIGESGCPWLFMGPVSGALDPGASEQADVYFEATGIPIGTVKEAIIHFESYPDVGTFDLPVTMTIGVLEFGFIEGNIILDGILPYDIGDVTEVLVEAGTYSGFPAPDGDFSIPVYPGTYDVTFTLYGYESQTIPDVVVEEGTTVSDLDVVMPCILGIISGTVVNIEGSAPIEGALVELEGTGFETTTASDGSYEFLVEAAVFNVDVTAIGFIPQSAIGIILNPQTTIGVDFLLQPTDGTIVVIDLDPTPTGQDLVSILENYIYGVYVHYTTSVTGYPLTEDVETVFLFLGIYSNNYELTEDDATVITAWLDAYDDRNLYMEGGDTWAYNDPTSLHGYFNILPLSDGSGDLFNVLGTNSYWSGATWTYTGENNWIDRIEPIAPAIDVLVNPDIGYFTAVAYDAGNYKTVGASHEIMGLVDGSGSEAPVFSVLVWFGYFATGYGALEGFVTELATGLPIEGATIEIMWTSGMSGSDGYYFIDDMLPGTWPVSCSAPGFAPDSITVTIEPGETTQLDFQLSAPVFVVDPLSLYVELEPNTQDIQYLNISNPGSASVDWMASLNILGDNNSDEIFDLIWEMPVGVGEGEAGIETNGNFIYTTKWNGTGEYYRYDMDGTFLEQIWIMSAAGTRDMAFDGTYFYGAAANPTVFELDLDNATLVSTFTAPTDCRAIAYNENDDAFYANNWGSNIVKFDKAGNMLANTPVGPIGDNYYGFAYDGYSSGSPYLWGYAQVGANQCELIQMSIPDLTETGLTFDVGSVLSGSDLAGGLAIDNHIQTGLYAFFGNLPECESLGPGVNL